MRTSWLFGLPGADFPQRILAAAVRARAEGKTLDLVSDEFGCPTYARGPGGSDREPGGARRQEGLERRGGIYHVVNGGHASRAEWAREVLRLAGVTVPTRDVAMRTWPRPSTPPLWGVLEPTPLSGGPLRDWQAALAEYATIRIHTQEPSR